MGAKTSSTSTPTTRRYWSTARAGRRTSITADQDWRDYLDVVTDSIANLGGIACVNTTAVLYEGDPTPLAQAIGERLSAIVVLPAEDERAILPTQNIDPATALARHLATVAAGTTPCWAPTRWSPH